MASSLEVVPDRPKRKPNCFRCAHHIDVADKYGLSSFCGFYDEDIDSETLAARNCPEFTDDPDD